MGCGTSVTLEIRKEVKVLKDPKTTAEEKKNAAYALTRLTHCDAETCSAIVAEDSLPPLVQLLRDGSDEAKMWAAEVLCGLSLRKECAAGVAACGAREPLEEIAKDQRKVAWEFGTNAWTARRKAREVLGRLPGAREVVLVLGIREKVQELKDPKASDFEKANAAISFNNWATNGGAVAREAMKAEGALPPLVQLLGAEDPRTHWQAAEALRRLARENPEVAQAIVDLGGREVLEAEEFWKLLPEAPEASETFGAGMVLVRVKALENGSAEEQSQAAEELGTWAATSDERRGAICQAGGCEALVALVVNGSDDAKWHAARALQNLANHAEAKEIILKADGLAILTPLAKHGKGKVKDAASEALNLLSLVDAKAKPVPVAETKPATEPAATVIPSGQGTRVAMFSARFDGGPMEKTLWLVCTCLCHLSLQPVLSCFHPRHSEEIPQSLQHTSWPRVRHLDGRSWCRW